MKQWQQSTNRVSGEPGAVHSSRTASQFILPKKRVRGSKEQSKTAPFQIMTTAFGSVGLETRLL